MANGYNMAIAQRRYRQPPEPPMMHLITGRRIDTRPPIPFPDFKLGTACRVRYWYDETMLLWGDDYHGGPMIGLWYQARFFLRLRGDPSLGVFILYRHRRDADPFPFLCKLSSENVKPRPSARRGPIPPWAQPRLAGF